MYPSAFEFLSSDHLFSKQWDLFISADCANSLYHVLNQSWCWWQQDFIIWDLLPYLFLIMGPFCQNTIVCLNISIQLASLSWKTGVVQLVTFNTNDTATVVTVLVTLCCRLQLYSSDFLICSSSCLQRSFWLASFSDSSSFLCLALPSCFSVTGDSTSTVCVTYWERKKKLNLSGGSVIANAGVSHTLFLKWFDKTFFLYLNTLTSGSFPLSLSNSSCSSLTLSSRFLSSSLLLHSLCSLCRSSCDSCSARCCRDISSCCTLLRRFSFSWQCAGKDSVSYKCLCLQVFMVALVTYQRAFQLCISPWWACCWIGRGWLTAAAGGPEWRSGFVSDSHSLLTDTAHASLSLWPPVQVKHKITFQQKTKTWKNTYL